MSSTLEESAPTARPAMDCPPFPPERLHTLVDIARWRAERQPHALAFTYLVDGEQQKQHLTYEDLDRRARAVAAELQARRLEGERVLLVFNPGLDFNTAVFACLYAGVVAVPVYPPDPFRAHRTLPRLQAIIQDARASLVLGSEEILSWAGQSIEATCGATALAMESIDGARGADWRPLPSDPHRLALLQYTSGSTGSPRGVMLSHGNLMHNLRALHRLDLEGAVAVCWVPPFHDMGLIGGLMLPVHSGRQVVLMSPLSFIQRPARWLWAMSEYRARTSPSPNFGYELCIRKVRPDECEGLDLSWWTAAINGAEPIRAETIDRFVEKFAPYGFRRETFYPAFGMAESTLLVTGGQRGDPVLDPTFSASALAQDHVVETRPGDLDGRRLVGCGQPLPGGRIEIVNPQTARRLPPDRVGEIWVRSDSVGLGYWNRPEETERVFRARLADDRRRSADAGPTYLRTGDLGFVHREGLFVTGRIKELIILAGRKYYPHDVERVVEQSHAAIKADGCAAFSVEVAGEEQLVVAAEILRPKRCDPDEVFRAIRRELVEEMELVPHAIVLAAVGSLLKTSSGKTRRRAIRELFVAGGLRPLAQWQADSAASAAGRLVDPPQTALEETLARLWSEVLAVEPIGRNDDFFALGGQSLRAVQLAGRISEELGLDVSLPVMFQQPTIAQLAEWIESHGDGRAKAERRVRLAPISRRPADAPAVLSSAEQRLWFFDRLEPNHPFYNMPVAARLSGPLDDVALERALAEIVARHDTLRTTYRSDGGRPVRRVADAADVPLARVDLTALPAEKRESELQQRLAQEARRPFDLAAGPLVRATLFRLADGEHVLLLALHHIVVDGWSMGVIAGEMGRLYEALRAGRPSPLAPPAIEYADFAAWQHEQLAGEAMEREIAYWRERLTPEPPALELPTDRPRPPRQTFRGALRPVEFPAELSDRLRQLAHAERTTLFAVLMTAYNVLLGRYAREEDVAVGTIVANRPRREIEPLVGFFANTLVLRTDLSGDPSFRELLGRVSEIALEAYAHQDVPFDKLVEVLDPQRHRNQAPLFQVALVLENMPLEFPAESGLQVEPITVDNGTAKYDLAMLFSEQAGRIVGHAEYSTDLFDAATIDRMIAALRTLLEAAAADPDRPISRLPLLDGAQRRRILFDLNATSAPPASEVCLHQLVEEQVRRAPQQPAVRCDGRQWTYEELDRAANRLARHLAARGVRVEEPVMVSLHRSAELVVALLGVLKAGGAYCPMDPELPTERMAFLLHDTQAKLVLTQRHLAPRLPAAGAEIVVLEEVLGGAGDDKFGAGLLTPPERPTGGLPESGRPAVDGVARSETGHNHEDSPHPNPLPEGEGTEFCDNPLPKGEGTEFCDNPLPKGEGTKNPIEEGEGADLGPPPCRVRPGNLAYILYTSGSTGRPKGVLIEHRSAASFLVAFSRVLRIDAKCRVLHFFSPSSDGSISDILSALANGACLVVAGPNVLHQDDGLQELVRRERVTTATLTPSMLPLLKPDQLPDLNTVCSVGEAAATEFVAQWGRPGRRLINGYGVTEAACGACMTELTDAAVARPPIGRPLEHVQIHILDEHLEPVPIGVPGEICIGGVQVGRGYLNRPDLTARSFVPDPFRSEPGAQLYRTGDLGRRLADGTVDFLGRLDHQVNLRGHRVEPGEIASVLERHPAVEQAVVVAREDQPGRVRLVAYVVPKDQTQGEAASGLATQLREHLAEQLPHYMVPAAMVLIDELPRTVQGKLDRNALPVPATDRREASADYLAPRTDHEELVAGVWRDLLQAGQVGVRDDFFELGGHSMLAVQVMAEIERRSGRRLPLAALFQQATVEHLARLLEKPETATPESSLVPLTAGTGRPLFCIHPAGGTVFCYRTLAEELGDGRPVFGLQAVGVDGLAAPHQRVEDMAAHYVQAVRGVQPTGPYLLCGWSLGGNLACEMARQLVERGDRIGLLALLDAAALPADREPDQSDFLPMVMEFFPDQDNLPLEQIQAMTVPQQLDYFIERAGQAEIVAPGDLAAAHHVFEVFKTSMKAVVEYRQPPYPGRITLFAAEHREPWFGGPQDPQLGWGRWAAGGVEVHSIPGGHIHMVHPPAVHIVAAKLRQCLDRAEAESG
jgi:amino acid adenylation domain-containing protein